MASKVPVAWKSFVDSAPQEDKAAIMENLHYLIGVGKLPATPTGFTGSMSIINYTCTIRTNQQEQQVQETRDYERAFSADYVTAGDPLTVFVTKVNATVDAWEQNSEIYYGPYFAICQSSGYGKSRLVTEAIKNEVYGFYVSFAAANSTAYPPRTEKFADILDNPGNEATHRFAVRGFVTTVLAVFGEYLRSVEVPTPASWYSYSAAHVKELRTHDIKDVFQTIVTKWKGPRTPFVFAFDEARSLVTSTSDAMVFCNVRAVLQEVSVELNKLSVPSFSFPFRLCGTFMDTTLKIANFAATSANDPSARRGHLLKETFHPLFIFPSVDVFQEDLFRLGRPLWGAYKESEADMIGFAKVKLMGGARDWKGCDNTATALAILSSRLALCVTPQAKIASQLVSMHMGTLVGVSPDRDYAFVYYPSEPILAEAAGKFMAEPEICAYCLRTLNQLISTHIVEDVGEMGELVARIILLQCFDACALRNERSAVFSRSRVTVHDFLRCLSGKNLLVGRVFDDLVAGELAFTHFVRIREFPTQEQLKWAFERRVAFQLWPYAEAVDIIIPIRLLDGTFSVIVVQVKNTTGILHYPSLMQNATVVAKKVLTSEPVNMVDISASNVLPTSGPGRYQLRTSPVRQDTDSRKRKWIMGVDDEVSFFNDGMDYSEDGSSISEANTTGDQVIGEGRLTSDKRSHVVVVMSFRPDVPDSASFRLIDNKKTISIGLLILGTTAYAHLAPYATWKADLLEILKSSSIYTGLSERDTSNLRRMMGIAELSFYTPPSLKTYL